MRGILAHRRYIRICARHHFGWRILLTNELSEGNFSSWRDIQTCARHHLGWRIPLLELTKELSEGNFSS